MAARIAGVLGIALVLSLGAGAGCGKKARAPKPQGVAPAVPAPLENPAGYCRDTCPRKVRCRLGQVAESLFDAEVDRCRDACLAWIQDNPLEADAQAPCYEHSQCGALSACLAEVERILQDRATPAKQKECRELCATLGTCQGDAIDCTLRCRTGSVPIFRALIRCGTLRCPELKTCVETHLSGREGVRKDAPPTAVDTPSDPDSPSVP